MNERTVWAMAYAACIAGGGDATAATLVAGDAVRNYRAAFPEPAPAPVDDMGLPIPQMPIRRATDFPGAGE